MRSATHPVGMTGLARSLMLVAVCALALAACKPNPPPDVLKTQRQAMEKARAVEGVLQNEADDRRRAIDDMAK